MTMTFTLTIMLMILIRLTIKVDVKKTVKRFSFVLTYTWSINVALSLAFPKLFKLSLYIY